jgi:hypothetical protein
MAGLHGWKARNGNQRRNETNKTTHVVLLEQIKEPPSNLSHEFGGGPCKGEKPAFKETGQAETCLTRPAIESQIAGIKMRL